MEITMYYITEVFALMFIQMDVVEIWFDNERIK